MRASLINFTFPNHESHIFLHVYIFHILDFPGIISFPKNYPEMIGIPRIRENSFKVETLPTTTYMLNLTPALTLTLILNEKKKNDYPKLNS